MSFIFMLAAIVVITVIALLAVGKLGELPDVTPDRAPLALPEDRVLTDQDVDALRFSVGARGYRMDEVDEVLDRLSAEVSERDARIAELEAQLGESGRLHDSGEDRPLGDALT
jgi:DivIVA domain-containing protein